MLPRRLIVIVIVAAVTLALGVSLAKTLAPGGWTLAKAIMLGSFLVSAPWFGFCAAMGAIGFAIRLHRPALQPPVSFHGHLPKTAIAIAVRNEDMALVLPPVRALLDGLDATGAGDAFAVFVLSDTADPAVTGAEEAAAAAFGAADRDPSRVHYRRRTENSGFKAGNVMDFLDRHADGFELMLILDADSQMTPDAVLRLVLAMRDTPSLGIIQHLTVGVPAASAFPRLFQFGMRAGMRTWASALAWWQGDECVYWGHNAVIRIPPFRAHCRLPLLPNGAHILSHDQIEAAILRGAGWGIRLHAEEEGSYEANPPALPEFTRRELRWLAGNLEYRHLLRLPGLRPMGRWQLIQAILLFGCAPFQVVMLLAAAWIAATDSVSPFPFAWALTASLLEKGTVYAPKLLGYLELLVSRDKRARYGGGARILCGVALETMFTLLMDPINTVSKTGETIRIALGVRGAWTPQNRGERGVTWQEASRLYWAHTLLGIGAYACFVQAGWTAAVWAVPFALGPVVAIPFCVATASPRLGAWLRVRKLAAIPEEMS